MAKKRKRPGTKRTKHTSISSLSIVLLLAAILLILSWLGRDTKKQSLQFNDNNTQSLSQGNVLGEDDEKKEEEEDKKELEKAEEEQKKSEEKSNEDQKKTEEKAAEESKKGESSSPTLAPDSIKVKTQNEGSKSETEVETLDGQKIKTKIEDDGTTKIEVEHRNLKIKYEVRNGKVETKAEDEEGNEVELDESELDQLESEVEDELENNGIKISTGGAGLMTFAKNKIAATTDFPLSIDVGTNQLVVTTPFGPKIVAVLPDQAVQNLLATGVINTLVNEDIVLSNEINNTDGVIEFTLRNEEPVYEVNGLKTFKLFAVIPVSRPVTAVVSSETGNLVAVEKSFLTNVIDLLSP